MANEARVPHFYCTDRLLTRRPGTDRTRETSAAGDHRYEEARRRFLEARHELTVAALEELVTRVRTRHPDAARMLFVGDDVEDGLYPAEIADRAGRPLGVAGPLLDDRTAAQLLGNIRGCDLASLPGVTRHRIPMTFTVEIDELV